MLIRRHMREKLGILAISVAKFNLMKLEKNILLLGSGKLPRLRLTLPQIAALMIEIRKKIIFWIKTKFPPTFICILTNFLGYILYWFRSCIRKAKTCASLKDKHITIEVKILRQRYFFYHILKLVTNFLFGCALTTYVQ